MFVLVKKLIANFQKLFKKKPSDQEAGVDPFNYPLF